MAFDDDIDPSIAALLADTQDEIPEVELNMPKKDGISSFGGPQNKDFENFVSEKASGKPKMNGCVPEVDLNIKSFAPIENILKIFQANATMILRIIKNALQEKAQVPRGFIRFW